MTKFLDFHGSAGELANEMLVTGLGSAVVFGLWWFVCRLFVWLGWESLGRIVHHGLFAVALVFVLGMILTLKDETVSVSYGAFVLDACLVAAFFLVVRGEFSTVWMLVALVGLAIWGVTQLPPIKAKLEARKEKTRKDAMLRTAEGLEAVEPGRGEEYLRHWSPEEVAKRNAEKAEMARKVGAFGAFMKQYEKKPGDPDEPEDSD